MKLILSVLFLFSFTIGSLISNSIPSVGVFNSLTKLQTLDLFKGQHFSYKFPYNTGYYSNRISNLHELDSNKVNCRWIQSIYNYSNVAHTKDLNLEEDEILIAGGTLQSTSTYYLVTNKNRLLEVQAQMSTRSLRLVNSQRINHNIQHELELINYHNALVFETNNTLVFIKPEGLSYIPIIMTDPVLKILAVGDYIYLLAQKKIKRWSSGIVEDIPLDNNNIEDLTDMDIGDQEIIYLLDSRRGIYSLKGNFVQQHLFAPSEGYFTKIRVINKTVQVAYTLQKTNFVVELYHFQDKLSINKIYPINAHINDIVIFKDYAVLVHDYHLTLLQHSANRNVPNLTYSQIISSILLVGISKVKKLNNQMVLLLRKDGAFLSRQIQMNPPELVCEFESPGIYNIEIEYLLPSCTNNEQQYDPINRYCVSKLSKTLSIKQGKKHGTVVFAYVIFAIFVIVSLAMIGIGIIICSKKIKIKQQHLLSMKKGRQKSQINETTAQNDSVRQDNKKSINATQFKITTNQMQRIEN